MVTEKGFDRRVSTNEAGRRAYNVMGSLYSSTLCSFCGKEYGKEESKHQKNWLVMQAQNSNTELFFCCSGHHVSYDPVKLVQQMNIEAGEIYCAFCNCNLTQLPDVRTWETEGKTFYFCNYEHKDRFMLIPCHKLPVKKWCDHKGAGDFMGHACEKKPLISSANPKGDIRPDYYHTESVYEPFKIIRYYGLNFFAGNALKYLLRAGKKNVATAIEDLTKARTYLNNEIEELQNKKEKESK